MPFRHGCPVRSRGCNRAKVRIGHIFERGQSVRILAIDPGPTESAMVIYDTHDGAVEMHDTVGNDSMAYHIAHGGYYDVALVVEMVACYGMPVGAEVFETCVWIGRFIQAWGRKFSLVYRKDEKMALCGSMRAKDSNIRQAIIDRFGGKVAAVGTKKAPGPLHGIKGDEWAALAVALTYTAILDAGEKEAKGAARD